MIIQQCATFQDEINILSLQRCVPGGTKPLHELIFYLSSLKYRGIDLGMLAWDDLKITINETRLKTPFFQIASISPRGQWFPAHYYFNKINVDSSWYVTLWQAHRQLTVVVSINLTCPLQIDIKSVSRVWSNSLYQPSAGSTSMTLELNKIKNEKYRKIDENIVCKMTFFVHDSMC